MRWLRDAVLNMSRRHEELKTRIMEEAAAGPLSLRERARVRAGGAKAASPTRPHPLPLSQRERGVTATNCSSPIV